MLDSIDITFEDQTRDRLIYEFLASSVLIKQSTSNESFNRSLSVIQLKFNEIYYYYLDQYDNDRRAAIHSMQIYFLQLDIIVASDYVLTNNLIHLLFKNAK